MLQPIQKDHESCCPNCGCVLSTINELPNESQDKPIIPYSVDILLLGSALDKNVKKSYNRTPKDYYEENALKHLENICIKFNLPSKFAIETYQEMKRKNRGFRSENEPVKQLLKILSKDENYIHIKKYKAIKARYESIINF